MNALAVQQESSIFERLLVSPDSALAVLSIHFSPVDQQRMRELMEKNNQGTITAEDQAEMEAFRQIGAFLAIVHRTRTCFVYDPNKRTCWNYNKYNYMK